MLKNNLKPFIVFAVVFLVYSSNAFIDYKKDLKTSTFRNLLTTHDVVTNNLFPYLFIKHKTFNFNVLERSLYAIRPSSSHKYFYVIEKDEGTRYSSFPLVSGFLSIPFYLIPVVSGWVANLEIAETIDIIKIMFLGRLSASFLTALTCAIFYKILNLVLKGKRSLILLITAFFSFGTLMWSISSRGLWQHTTSLLFIVLVMFLHYSENIKQKDILIGFFTGLSVLSRYSSVFFAIPIFLYYLFYKKDKLSQLLLGAAPILVILLSINKIFYGNLLNTGYGAREDIKFTTPLFEGLAGLLISPSRGLLFIMPPLFIATFYGVYLLFKKRGGWDKYGFENLIFIGFLSNLIFFSKWYAWHGANSFGPRMLIEFIPILCIFLAYFLTKTNKHLFLLLSILVGFSVFVEFNAVFYRMSRCHPRDNWTCNCIKPPSNLNKYFNTNITYFDNLTKPVSD